MRIASFLPSATEINEAVRASVSDGRSLYAATRTSSTSWDVVLDAEPELVVVGPCGFGIREAAARSTGLELPCPAVAVNGDAYYSRPGPRLGDGVRQLAYLLHPDAVPDPGLPAVGLNAQASVSS
jgi:iron complex transport system substrate-binding protein